MEEKLVTLRRYMYPSEAYPLMSKLESEGINCFLNGENTITVHPFLSNAIGGVRLTIRESDLDKANNIIRQTEEEFGKMKLEEEKPVPEEFSKGFVKVDTFCPECDSTLVFRKKMLWWKVAVSFISKKHCCAACGYEWKQ